ncbi:MAG: toxin-activating lysine-acyltransferase [Ahrensia sp.]|nr:toxin-activating lysine-acyltransferase [Ahrensia sp.]
MAVSASHNAGVASGNAAVDMKNRDTFASTIGHITWLASMSTPHKDKPISWLEEVVFPALLLRQFKLYFKEKQPVALIVYGLLSEEQKAAFEASGELPHLDRWRSGENVVVFECISPFAERESMIAEFLRDTKSRVKKSGNGGE